MEKIFTLDTLEEVAHEFIYYLENRKVVALNGSMGAGKTTFVREVCRQLGVTGNISSPTYAIIHEYAGKVEQVIYHVDLYRLKDEEEALQAGVEDCLYSGNTCFVEWAEKAPDIFPEDTLHITITAIDMNTRKLKINL